MKISKFEFGNFNLIYRKKKKNIWIIQIINKRQHLTSLDAQKICTARKRKKNKVMNQMSDRIMSTFNRIILLCVTWIKILGSLNSDPTGIHWSSMFSQMGSTSLWSRILILILPQFHGKFLIWSFIDQSFWNYLFKMWKLKKSYGSYRCFFIEVFYTIVN